MNTIKIRTNPRHQLLLHHRRRNQFNLKTVTATVTPHGDPAARTLLRRFDPLSVGFSTQATQGATEQRQGNRAPAACLPPSLHSPLRTLPCRAHPLHPQLQLKALVSVIDTGTLFFGL